MIQENENEIDRHRFFPRGLQNEQKKRNDRRRESIFVFGAWKANLFRWDLHDYSSISAFICNDD